MNVVDDLKKAVLGLRAEQARSNVTDAGGNKIPEMRDVRTTRRVENGDGTASGSRSNTWAAHDGSNAWAAHGGSNAWASRDGSYGRGSRVAANRRLRHGTSKLVSWRLLCYATVTPYGG